MKSKIITIIAAITLLFSILNACDHTKLSGDIKLLNETLKKGETIPLRLEVPQKLEDIYRVMWSIEPSDDATFIYGEEVLDRYTVKELEELFGESSPNPDRIAVFIPEDSGKYTIYADGFYKQTNPQPITKKEIEISN